ncbi:putative uncharacterized protein DDB_G0277255 [Sitodiplosis mosellana]|uniref:putative uncharacterized protein DDB_G0277255 n=1 Tax=Sitodiplosis mosellana TaxID=263140 RepID=UPI00244399AF|nr:putative uncharacterized protein DDB_G0277255 [Sitodiplosis mosellana]
MINQNEADYPIRRSEAAQGRRRGRGRTVNFGTAEVRTSSRRASLDINFEGTSSINRTLTPNLHANPLLQRNLSDLNSSPLTRSRAAALSLNDLTAQQENIINGESREGSTTQILDQNTNTDSNQIPPQNPPNHNTSEPSVRINFSPETSTATYSARTQQTNVELEKSAADIRIESTPDATLTDSTVNRAQPTVSPIWQELRPVINLIDINRTRPSKAPVENSPENQQEQQTVNASITNEENSNSHQPQHIEANVTVIQPPNPSAGQSPNSPKTPTNASIPTIPDFTPTTRLLLRETIVSGINTQANRTKPNSNPETPVRPIISTNPIRPPTARNLNYPETPGFAFRNPILNRFLNQTGPATPQFSTPVASQYAPTQRAQRPKMADGQQKNQQPFQQPPTATPATDASTLQDLMRTMQQTLQQSMTQMMQQAINQLRQEFSDTGTRGSSYFHRNGNVRPDGPNLINVPQAPPSSRNTASADATTQPQNQPNASQSAPNRDNDRNSSENRQRVQGRSMGQQRTARAARYPDDDPSDDGDSSDDGDDRRYHRRNDARRPRNNNNYQVDWQPYSDNFQDVIQRERRELLNRRLKVIKPIAKPDAENISTFVRAVNILMNAVESQEEDEYVTEERKMKVTAVEFIPIQNIMNCVIWTELRTLLEREYKATNTENALEAKLKSLTQKHAETIAEFGERARKLFHEYEAHYEGATEVPLVSTKIAPSVKGHTKIHCLVRAANEASINNVNNNNNGNRSNGGNGQRNGNNNGNRNGSNGHRNNNNIQQSNNQHGNNRNSNYNNNNRNPNYLGRNYDPNFNNRNSNNGNNNNNNGSSGNNYQRNNGNYQRNNNNQRGNYNANNNGNNNQNNQQRSNSQSNRQMNAIQTDHAEEIHEDNAEN